MVKIDSCNLCGNVAKQKCSGCLSVGYCSKEHQRLDWRIHKVDCAAFEVVVDAGMGRCLVAKRDIRAGEVVLRERPLVCGPAQVTAPVCLGCHTGLNGPSADCNRCGWPVCSTDCASSPAHRPECDWAVSKRKEKVRISNFIFPHPTYACITALRVLHAKKTDPKLWSKISSLEGHKAERQKDGKWEQERFAVAKFLKRFYRLEEEVTEEEILDICGIIQINGHEVPLSEPAHVSLYWKCSFIEHSCRPNCGKSFSDSGEVVIRAGCPVKTGEHLSICYTDALWGTPSRLHHLHGSKYFKCHCQRCGDPTEMGTYFSAVLCRLSECKGKLLPSSFSEPGLLWKCSICCNSCSPEDVSARLVESAGRLSKVNKSSPSSCLDFLDSPDCLPENHYHRVEVKLALAQLIGQTGGGGLGPVSDHWLKVKESLCRELLALSSILFPAECRIRGILYFELHAAVAEGARREAVRGGDDSVPTQLMETRRYLENAIDHLKYEPQVLPEGKICKQARENLYDLDKLLKSMNVSIMGGL